MDSLQSAKPRNRNIFFRYSSDMNWKMDKYHFHDMYEVYYSLTNNVDIFVNDVIYQVSKGTILVFNTADIHRTIPLDKTPYNRFIIHFNPEYMKDLCTAQTDLLDCFINRGPQFNHSLHLDSEQMEQFAALVDKAKRYQSNALYGQDIYLKLTLAEILLFINPLYQDSIRCFSQKSKREFERIYPILQHIQTNISDNLSLDSLSERYFINKFYLINLFKKATGFTITEYIIQTRIMKACELLKRGLSVQQVGELVGFNDNSHFIRTFKKHVGLPPKRYAQQFI